uniref:K Homology domain-containing protein n=1 Tax=Panagrolaimus sp. JU765 TaxID=591449 RepID=A0AC34QYU9_9BILA
MSSKPVDKPIEAVQQNQNTLADGDKRKKRKSKKKVKENVAKTPQFSFPTSCEFMSEEDREILVNMLKELILMLQYERIKRSGKFDLLFFLIVQRISAAVEHMQIQAEERTRFQSGHALDGFSDLFKGLSEIGSVLHQNHSESFVLPESEFKVSKQHKILVPEHPNYNFIGRILGPRGISVRQLESATGCGILIRGKGSVKNGQREEMLRCKETPGFEPLKEQLHVLITAKGRTESEAERKLDNCRRRIEMLLKPEYDDYKRRQLAELAIINGSYIQQER